MIGYKNLFSKCDEGIFKIVDDLKEQMKEYSGSDLCKWMKKHNVRLEDICEYVEFSFKGIKLQGESGKPERYSIKEIRKNHFRIHWTLPLDITTISINSTFTIKTPTFVMFSKHWKFNIAIPYSGDSYIILESPHSAPNASREICLSINWTFGGRIGINMFESHRKFNSYHLKSYARFDGNHLPKLETLIYDGSLQIQLDCHPCEITQHNGDCY